MNIKKIQELVELMNANELSEINIEQQDGMKIRLLRKGHGQVEQQLIAPQAVPMAQPMAQPVAAPQAAPAPMQTNYTEVKSPMVGTFYRAASPDAGPYVQVGDTVHKGDVLCIVEAMKLMNEVKSEVEGRIVEILVENTDPVEFGQTIFLVEPI